jgi:hypothetical protein
MSIAESSLVLYPSQQTGTWVVMPKLGRYEIKDLTDRCRQQQQCKARCPIEKGTSNRSTKGPAISTR